MGRQLTGRDFGLFTGSIKVFSVWVFATGLAIGCLIFSLALMYFKLVLLFTAIAIICGIGLMASVEKVNKHVGDLGNSGVYEGVS